MKLLLAILIAICSVAHALDLPIPIHQSGVLPSGVSYELTIQESPYSSPDELQPASDDGSFWGVDGGYPESIVTTFDLKIDGKSAYIPRKFYSDLSDAHTVSVSEKNGGQIVVVIKGSDAAGGYDCEMVFQKNRLIQRTTRVGEFADEVWEKVILHNDLLDHPENFD